jgi:hypothetical protein
MWVKDHKLELAEFFLDFPSTSPVLNVSFEALAFSFAFYSFLQTPACSAEHGILAN